MYYEVRVNLLRQRTSKSYPLRQRWNWSVPTLLSDKKQQLTNLPRNCWSVTKALNRIWKNSIDRKSTRLNSSHVKISYADFCLKKKHQNILNRTRYHIASETR